MKKEKTKSIDSFSFLPMRCKYDTPSFSDDISQNIPEKSSCSWIHASGRFIKKENRRITHERNSSTQFPFVTTTERKNKMDDRIFPLSHTDLYVPHLLLAYLFKSKRSISVCTAALIFFSGIPLSLANIVNSSLPVSLSIRASNCGQ